MSTTRRPATESEATLLTRIALELHDTEQIVAGIRREALAARQDAASPAAPAGGRSPQTEAEIALHGIWIELLNVSACSVDDDFFALGGSSLLAAQMLSRIQDRFGVDLPLDTVFADSLTLAAIAERIAQALEMHQAPGTDAAITSERRNT